MSFASEKRMRQKPYFAYRSFRKELVTRERFAQAGVRQFCLFSANTCNSLGEPYSEYGPIWLWYDVYDFTAFDAQAEDMIRLCPEAQFLCMIDLNSPLWFFRQLDGIDSYSHLSVANASAVWRKHTEKYLTSFLRHAEEKYGDRILCYIPSCGSTDEWADYGSLFMTPDRLTRYREWCVARGLPEPDDIPGVAALLETPGAGETLRDPQKNAAAIQFWKFHNEFVADSILHFAGLIRQTVRREVEIGAFYGYLLEFTWERLCRVGHLAYEKLQESGLIDFVISPGSYHDREMGGGSGFMTPNGTVHLNGLNSLYEIDHRTHTANMQVTQHAGLGWMKKWENDAADVAGLRREFCRALFHGASLWWFDMWGGFFQEACQLTCIQELLPIWEKYADRRNQPDAEIAVIVDPQSAYLINDRNELVTLQNRLSAVLNRLGTPVRLYSLNDVPKLPPEIKLVIFSGVIELPQECLTMLQREVFGRRHCFWYGPSGLTDGTTWREPELPGEKFPDFTKITPEVLRAAAERAGVHFYTDELCPVWAGNGLLSVHTATGGKLRILLKEKAAVVTELFSNRIVATDTAEFYCDLAAPDTVLFQLTTTSEKGESQS